MEDKDCTSTGNHKILEGGIPKEKMSMIVGRSVGKSYWAQNMFINEMKETMRKQKIDNRNKKIDEILK